MMVHITLSLVSADCSATPDLEVRTIDAVNDRVGPVGNPLEPRFGWRPDLDPVPDLSPPTAPRPESPPDAVPEIRESEPPAGEALVSEPEVGVEPIPEPEADVEPVSEPEADDAPVSEPLVGDEPGPEPDVVSEPLGRADYWEPSRTWSQQSALDVPNSWPLRSEGPVRWLGVPPVMVYGLLVVMIFAGVLGVGLWMRDQRASPNSTAAHAPASSGTGGSQMAVGGGSGVPDVPGKTVHVTVGETVYLGLPVEQGHGPWKVSSPDPAVLTPVKSPMESTADTTMLAFKAIGTGQTVVTATRQDACPAGQQCPDTTRHFEETVVVGPS